MSDSTQHHHTTPSAPTGWGLSCAKFIGVTLLGATALGVVACSGETAETAVEVVAPTTELDQARFEEAWPVAFAEADSFADYTGEAWVAISATRDYRLGGTSKDLSMSRARAHAEAASLFRQAALVSGNAAIETYAKTPQPTDPVGAAHLLSVGYALNGDLAKAREASARLDGVTDVTSPWHGPWATWLAGDAAWPPDLSALPIDLGPPTPGTWPELSSEPHYSMPVQTDDGRAQPMGDLGALVALSMWHEAAAKAAAGPEAAAVATYIARYRFPIEPVPVGGALPMAFVYASDMLEPEDGPFMADLMGDKGVGAVDAHASKSLTAYLASQARGPGGKIDAEMAVDVAAELRKAMLEKMVSKTEGTVEGHHRSFADMARVGLLRNLSLIAEEEGDREESGKLRILAMEGSHEYTGCTVALMSLAAWDANNRYPSRAQEIIHRSSRFYPSLDTARYGLDVLALRVSREGVQNPGY